MSSELFVIGLSHRTSPVALRERLAVSDRALADALASLTAAAELEEAMLLSTCNRVEVYVSGDSRERTASRIAEWLGERAGERLDSYLYVHHGEQAVRHAFRVAASLDSMVVGEPQILGQVKDAVSTAKSSRALGTLLERCFNHAFAAAKRVRTETAIAAGSVSISSIAGDLATKIFGDLSDRRVLLIGAGEMGEAAGKHLRKGGSSLYILNRSREKADALAQELDGHARDLEELAAELTLADVAIASTSSERFVITPELMKGVIKARRHRPLFLIDIAVPRDVDPRVGQLDNVFLYDVDDLSQLADENLRARQREAELAETIVEAEVVAFESWRHSGAVKPTIVELRNKVHGVLSDELARSLPRLGSVSDADRRALDKMVEAMTNKLLHHAISELKSGAQTPDGRALIEHTRRLFQLDEREPKSAREQDDVEVPSVEPARDPRKAT